MTTIQVPNITRLYARWTNEDNVGMYVELGIGLTGGGVDPVSGGPEQDDGVKLRHAYGWWDVTPEFQIMAGKSTTPFSPLDPSQLLGTRSGSVNIIGVGYGNYYSGRFAQLRGEFKFGKMGRVAIALVDPNGTVRMQTNAYQNFFPYDQVPVQNPDGTWRNAVLSTDYQNNTKLPRIDIGVPLYFGPVSIYPSFMYQHRTVDVINAQLSRYDNSLDTYVGSLGFKAGFGPFGIAAEGQYGKNWANSRCLIGTSAPAGLAAAVIDLSGSGKVNDATSYAYWIDASYKIGPLTPHVMFGQMHSEVDVYHSAEARATSSFWGFSIPIDLAKGFRVRPELMWYDDGELQVQGDDAIDFGSYAIYGVQFQITF